MKVEFLAHSKSMETLPKPYLPEIAFVGKSNAGKSSLINALVGQKIARSSSTPGRTQGLVLFKVRPNLVFVDFPGYGYAKISKKEREDWKVLAERYFQERRTLKKTIWIYDIRRDPDPLDFQMKEWLVSQGKPFRLALTKIDTLKRGEWPKRQKAIEGALELEEEDTLLFSSPLKEGVKPLWRWIDASV
ncbi:MAG: ribosome biogenesis GTP-binding protein YihA/YsxC [bacterium]